MAKDGSAIKLADVLPAVDRKDRDWWESLNQEQKDKFPAWLYMRYTSNVDGNADLSRYYLMAVNETVNKRFNVIRHHPKLQYLLMTAASPGMGSQRHTWIAPTKKNKSNKRLALISSLYPAANSTELEILDKINSDEDIISYLQDMGWDQKKIKNSMVSSNDD